MNREVIKNMSICCNYNTSIACNYMNTYSENMAQLHWLLCCNTNTGVMFKKICTITTCYVLLYTRTCHYERLGAAGTSNAGDLKIKAAYPN